MAEAPPRPDPAPFELSGGDLCLDFVNTWGDRGRPETDGLVIFPQLLAFARQTGILSPEDAEDLGSRAGTREATKALGLARVLREALYAIFSARAQGQPVPEPALACLNGALGEALPNLRLAFQGEALAWHWEGQGSALTSPLWPIARAAADLLTGGTAPIRECGGAQCTWLFLDLSRGRSRRWCSMASCGNRAKARRHYRRSRQGPTGRPGVGFG